MGSRQVLTMSDDGRPKRERKVSSKIGFMEKNGKEWEETAKKQSTKRKSGGEGGAPRKRKASSKGGNGVIGSLPCRVQKSMCTICFAYALLHILNSPLCLVAHSD